MIRSKRTKGKLNSDFGMKDYYNYYKKNNKESVNRNIYSNVIFDFNKEISEMIINENFEYYIPYIDSVLCVRKKKSVPKIIDGKVINRTPIDWKATEQLWNENEEAKEKKILIKYSNYETNKFIFFVYFKKYLSSFSNKKYYKFDTCRGMSRLLSKRIKDDSKDKYDAYLLY